MSAQAVAVAVDNPYWHAVERHTEANEWGRGRVVRHSRYSIPVDLNGPSRRGMVKSHAWTISDPATVDFVISHCGDRVVDPMAGNGYWPYLLGQFGVDVYASDLNPPDLRKNEFHGEGRCFVPVAELDAVDAVQADASRTLFLSWPPYGGRIGARVVNAYKGDRIVYVGEGRYGCCGNEAMFRLLDRFWTRLDDHTPVQWSGMHDEVVVFDRQAAS